MSSSSWVFVTSLLIVVTTTSQLLLAGVHGISSRSSSNPLHSICSTTLYPDICYSTLTTADVDAAAAAAANTSSLSTQKHLIQVTLNKTKEIIQANIFTINNFLTGRTTTTPIMITNRTKIALHDCLHLGAETIRRLDMVIQHLTDYHPTPNYYYNKKKKSSDPLIIINNLKTFMSTTITNKETCLDGFTHDAPSKRLLRKSIKNGQDYGGKMCSNVLAMISNIITQDDVEYETNINNKINMDEQQKLVVIRMWPEWLSAGDRKLLQSETVTPNVTVATDGSGDYTTVGAAVAAAPSKSVNRYVIKIAAGVYRENVAIPSSKTNIMFIGDGRSNTIITASESVAGGNSTFDSATVAAVGDGFLARDITFQNAAGPAGEQAVALRVGSDLSAFYRCGMLAYQDTLYVHSNRQFYVNCMIVGTVDFIFGNAAVVFQNCDIQARLPGPKQKNMVTAQGRTDPNQNTGIVIQKCRISGTSDLLPVIATYPTYLGRPWKEYSRTVVMQSTISDVINPAGWYPWDGDFALNTLYYREYQNTGPGADTSNRVTWPGWGVITNTTEAQSFTAGSFIDGGSWLQSTGFPYSLGL
ncbi:pectinesterase-like [Rutidosis leptorrhynchoides]|uniref:pectinesterase-like n=1 Tax=Rutidosis leptorrhynchoides TaxID=125765 RepID=UPI003A998C14